MRKFLTFILAAIAAAISVPVHAGTWLPTLFSDNMMLQRHKPIKIWGFGEPGKSVTVRLKKGDSAETHTSVIGSTGRFEVSFPAREASFEPYTLTVDDGKTTITVKDILIGEIWVAGGQSNMALRVDEQQEAVRNEILGDIGGDRDRIRIFIEPEKPSGDVLPYDQQRDVANATWRLGNESYGVRLCSAVGYYMAKGLQRKLEAAGDPTPVGVLCTARSGAPVESFLSREEVESEAFADTRSKLIEFGQYYDRSTWTGQEYIITGYYNSKIAPLAGFNVAGMIWYQGEANWSHPEIYAEELRALRRCWSRTFGFGSKMMPMIYNHIATWVTELGLVNVNEAMTDAWRMMADDGLISLFPIYDTDLSYTGNRTIHPTNKKPVGTRYVTAVYNTVYTNNAPEYTCPVVRGFTTDANGVITVNFDHAGDGLATIDGSGDVIGFTAACADGIHVNVPARISPDGTSVILTTNLREPRYIAYAWQNRNMGANLCNSIGLPAAPYRSNRTDTQQFTANLDWLEADAPQIWGYIWAPESPDAGWAGGYNPSWTAENAHIEFVGDGAQYHGKAALKVDAQAQAKVSAGVDSYSIPANNGISANKSLRANLSGITALSFFIKNPDARSKNVTLSITAADGRTYSSTATVAANSGYTLVTFPVGAAHDPDLGIIRALWFTVPPGTLYLDHGRILPPGYIAPQAAPVDNVIYDAPTRPERLFTPSGLPVDGYPRTPGLYISASGQKLVVR